jgi:group I intron endonuclease
MESGIYSIRNIENGKVYIGSAVSIKKRWQGHKLLLGKKCHENSRLQNAWNKYGAEKFDFQILESVDDISRLIEREQFWMDEAKAANKAAGYNLRPKAGSQLGFKHSLESREKNAAAKRGKTLSPEHREKIRIAGLGRIQSPETREKLAAFHTGLKLSQATKDKLRVARLLQGLPPVAPRTPEYKAKISATLKGRKLSPEHSAKSAAARKGLKRSPEAIINAVAGRVRQRELRAAA